MEPATINVRSDSPIAAMRESARSSMSRGLTLAALSTALFFSGAAGLINQVVWQRALKVFLGGSETISAMIVVLVFLAGIGFGSVWMSARTGSEKPNRVLSIVELSLAIANVLICYLLNQDIAESIYSFQRIAVGIGIPVSWIYAFGAFAILLVPCFLMGTTIPLASDFCQRELSSDSRLVNWLYGVNTLGSVLGALLGLAVLVPHFGQSAALLVSAGLNFLASFILFAFVTASVANARAQRDFAPRETALRDDQPADRITGFAILAFGFGFCALWYELFLYRAIALAHEPLPLVFSSVLTGYLVYWSLGTLASSLTWVSNRLSMVVMLCILSELGALSFLSFDQERSVLFTWVQVALFLVLKAPLFIPCFLFGMLFGTTLRRVVRCWGRDVAWFGAWNTAGSCAGILIGTLAGYEVSLPVMLFLQWLGLMAMAAVFDRMRRYGLDSAPQLLLRYGPVFWLKSGTIFGCGLLALSLFLFNTLRPPRPAADGSVSLYGRDGVILVDADRNVVWDGLWHSRLSLNNDHIGTYNWALAVNPVLAHPTGNIKEALVIGVGSGITLGTLAKLDSVDHIDAYDINQTIRRLLRLFPVGTLDVASNPKIRIIWQDGRSGLALNSEQYDLITQQPLYLKQAGSSILLSKEYFKLVSTRLKPDGVFCVYSNGTPQQAMAVRQTASEVFPHMLVLHSGYQLILSQSPITTSPERMESRIAQKGLFWEEVRTYRAKLGLSGWERYLRNYQLPTAGTTIAIRDDFPIVEYPHHLQALVEGVHFQERLPRPSFP